MPINDLPARIPGDLDQRLPQPVARPWVLHRTAADGTEETVCGGCQGGDQDHVSRPAIEFVTLADVAGMVAVIPHVAA